MVQVGEWEIDFGRMIAYRRQYYDTPHPLVMSDLSPVEYHNEYHNMMVLDNVVYVTRGPVSYHTHIVWNYPGSRETGRKFYEAYLSLQFEQALEKEIAEP